MVCLGFWKLRLIIYIYVVLVIKYYMNKFATKNQDIQCI